MPNDPERDCLRLVGDTGKCVVSGETAREETGEPISEVPSHRRVSEWCM